MDPIYLVRYGLMGELARFASDSGSYERGQTVVVRSHRGTELGEILTEVGTPQAPSNRGLVLRVAGADDFERARQADLDRSRRFDLCRRVTEEGRWPIELVDVEPLLDEGRAVVRYLGPHHLDAAGLLETFRAACQIEIVLEPVGLDVPGDQEAGGGCGSCGSGGSCGSSSGCGAASAGDSPSGGGCSSCGLKQLLRGARRTPAKAP
jgi:cell fate regulator YaaT (PSP1 superfamily)